jgi:hypothetical protein
MKLFEVEATEYNGEQEYPQCILLVAENFAQAQQIARDYFQQWYGDDDEDEPQNHNTDYPDEFEFMDGCIRLKIESVQETTLDEWVETQITLHSISPRDEFPSGEETGIAAAVPIDKSVLSD